MTKLYLSLLTLLFLSFAGCRKDIRTAETDIDQESLTEKAVTGIATEKGVVSTNHWYGKYTDIVAIDDGEDGPPGPGHDPDLGDVSDQSFIQNGVARLPEEADISFSSDFSFDIPAEYNIPGDSLIFEATVKNNRNESISNYDVILLIAGEQHTAEVHFVADKAFQSSTQYSIGSAGYTNVPALVHYFSDFESLKLGCKQGQTGTYINNKLVYRFKYGADNRIGRVKTISIRGKGYVTIDNVKLSNSVTNKKLMTEDFNTTGESHTIFY